MRAPDFKFLVALKEILETISSPELGTLGGKLLADRLQEVLDNVEVK